jgi:Oxidoreductase family, NAD-binding Rossmann fold/Oxidoreductase family, C-terminal alpha/beta domain
VSVSDVDTTRANDLAAAYAAQGVSVDDMIHDDSIEVIYIATPPSSHAPLAIRALKANKHVLCEKPLATTVADAEAIVNLAAERGCFAVANLLQRYNPIARAIRTVVKDGLLGAPLHATVENLAADEGLPPSHWFWDDALSGGVFIEHAVHFFDLFAFWLGRGEVESASRVLRPGSGVEEQVRSTVAYGDGEGRVLVDSYHGFHRPACLDRMRTSLVFEHGDVTLAGWIPTMIDIDALVGPAEEAALQELFAPATVTTTRLAADSHIDGRHKPILADRRVHLHAGSEADKMQRYGELVRDVLHDQLAWLDNRDHARHLTEIDSCEAVRVAIAATTLARQVSATL